MKRRMLASLVVVLGSCGGSDRTVDDPLVTAQAACASYAEVYCTADAKCEPATYELYWNDEALCRERSAVACLSRLSATGTNDIPVRVAQCARELARLSCDSYLDSPQWPLSCAAPPGRLSDGASCVTSGQCEGRLCSIGTYTPCGVCRKVAELGEACMSELDCVDTFPCIDGICTARGTSGDKCNDTNGPPCVVGTFCEINAPAGDGVCRERVPVGASCSPAIQRCLESLECADSFQCVPRRPIPKAGEPCNIMGQCNVAARCGSGALCVAKPREGEPCLAGSVECLSPSRCIAGTCKIRDASVCQ